MIWSFKVGQLPDFCRASYQAFLPPNDLSPGFTSRGTRADRNVHAVDSCRILTQQPRYRLGDFFWVKHYDTPPGHICLGFLLVLVPR